MVENQVSHRLLTDNDCIVICAGVAAFPLQDEQTGKLKESKLSLTRIEQHA
jgi:hypothetical protein